VTPFETTRYAFLARKLGNIGGLNPSENIEYESLVALMIEETRIAIIKGKGWTMVPYKHERPVRYVDPDSILPIVVSPQGIPAPYKRRTGTEPVD
jgi:hypothetical protein